MKVVDVAHAVRILKAFVEQGSLLSPDNIWFHVVMQEVKAVLAELGGNKIIVYDKGRVAIVLAQAVADGMEKAGMEVPE